MDSVTEHRDTGGELVRAHRTDAGIGVRELARCSGYSHSYIIQIESGKKTAGPAVIGNLLVAIGNLIADRKAAS